MTASEGEPRQRDSVRVSVARRAVADARARLELLERVELARLETDVVLVDVRLDLEHARCSLLKIEETLGRIEEALKR